MRLKKSLSVVLAVSTMLWGVCFLIHQVPIFFLALIFCCLIE
uniref:Uncharacterized protein n=1 Tax=Anguilla anguilla TaxID=7936 RepID=A0A0E9VQ51_ANGAN